MIACSEEENAARASMAEVSKRKAPLKESTVMVAPAEYVLAARALRELEGSNASSSWAMVWSSSPSEGSLTLTWSSSN